MGLYAKLGFKPGLDLRNGLDLAKSQKCLIQKNTNII